MTRQHWLLKSEPSAYGYAQLVEDKKTAWTGIRNFQARNNLRKMQPGDLALYYHTGDERAVVGIARVLSAAAPDPTAPGEDWASVDIAPLAPLKQPVTLATIKQHPALANFALIKQGRLSVAPVTAEQFQAVLKLGRTPAP